MDAVETKYGRQKKKKLIFFSTKDKNILYCQGNIIQLKRILLGIDYHQTLKDTECFLPPV